MSVSNLNDFPIHEISININTIKLAILIVGLIKFTLLKIISSLFWASQSSNILEDDDIPTTKNTVDMEKKEEESVCGGEVEMVLRSLGLHCCQDQKLPARVDAEGIFEERDPSLDEVREAFDVFDENRDGFIDERELQRVMVALGFKEGLEMENCRRMIGGFDEDGDGKIDFHEFVQFMENSLI